MSILQKLYLISCFPFFLLNLYFYNDDTGTIEKNSEFFKLSESFFFKQKWVVCGTS